LERIGGIDHVQLRFAPDDAEAEIRPWLRPGWSAAGQGGGDLGERLARSFQNAFAARARRVVIIGGDCPEVAAQDIEAAWGALARCDLVLGPAADGGYWLIGLRVMERRLFEGIAWSTRDVLQQTLDHARAAGLTVELLRELHDVDTEADWRRFLQRTK
jgi:rSAM/selenodomain-associated transferase 1